MDLPEVDMVSWDWKLFIGKGKRHDLEESDTKKIMRQREGTSF
jgi:hypothetical protein